MVNPYGPVSQGSYVPPAPGAMAPSPTGGMPYAGDQYSAPPGMYPPAGGAPGGARPNSGPNLLMVGGLALGGFLLFGPIGALVGGLIGLFLH